MTLARWVVVVTTGVVPWIVIPFEGGVSLVLAWGLLDVGSLHATSLATYLFEYVNGIPGFVVFWPIGVVMVGASVLSVTSAVVGWGEDRRVSSGLLVIAGGCVLGLAMGLVNRGSIAVPVGTLVLWWSAWYVFVTDSDH